MAIQRTDIERALDEITFQEEGMRFQGLAVVLGKRRWPELIAHPRKKDFGLDAYARAGLTPEHFGKGLAASITPTLTKVSDDARTATQGADVPRGRTPIGAPMRPFAAYPWRPCRGGAASSTYRVPPVIRRILWIFLRSTYARNGGAIRRQ